MASKIIVTDALCRAGYVHLAAPFAHTEKDTPKYGYQAMWPKDNVYNLDGVGEFDSHPYEIIDALNEVCLAEFNLPINDIPDVAMLKDELGIQFPPNFIDGDTVKLKENGRPVPGQFNPTTAGYWLMNLSSPNDPDTDEPIQPGFVGPDEIEIDPKTIYSGCWVRPQLEISAYYNKSNQAIVSIKLLNMQMCYTDESLGGRAPTQDAKSAFAGRAVKNTNVPSGQGQRMGRPQAGRPAQQASAGNRPARPGRPGTAPAQQEPTLELVALTETSIEECRTTYGMTDDEIVNEGYGEWQEVAPAKPARPARPNAAPNRPARPGVSSAPAKPAKPARPGRPDTSAPAKPTKPVPRKPAPKKPTGPKVVMYEDAEFTYDELIAEGWTDEDIVNSGYGEFDYTDADQ